MGLKNLFNRKTNNNAKHHSTQNNVVEDTIPTNTTTPHVKSRVRIEEELEQVFKKFDINGDGKISSSELGSIMGSLSHRPTDNELDNMITKLDSNGDGFIDLKEFIELNTNGVDSAELLESLKDAFAVFDVDKNGLITADELQHVLCSLGEEFSIGECRKMIAGVDQDGDGVISFDEFKIMMMNGSRFGAMESSYG